VTCIDTLLFSRTVLGSLLTGARSAAGIEAGAESSAATTETTTRASASTTDERKRVIEQFVLLEVAEIFHQIGTEVLEYLTGNGLERIGETDVSLAITRDPLLHFGDEDELSDQHRQHQDQYQYHKQRHSPLTRAKVLSRDDRQLVHRRLRIPSKPASGNHSSPSDQFIGRSHASLH